MTSTQFHLQIKFYPIQSHQIQRMSNSERISSPPFALAQQRPIVRIPVPKQRHISPNPWALNTKHHYTLAKCRGRCTLLPQTNIHICLNQLPNPRKFDIHLLKQRSANTQKPKTPKKKTPSNWGGTRNSIHRIPAKCCANGSAWSGAYIGGGAGRAEGETAEEGAGRQGLRVHGARVCHGHADAAIPLPPKLHKFFSSCCEGRREEMKERKGKGREEERRDPCVVGRVGDGLIREWLGGPHRVQMDRGRCEHTRLRARDYFTSSTLIGRKGGGRPSSLHTTFEGPTEYSLPAISVNPREWIKVNLCRGANS